MSSATAAVKYLTTDVTITFLTRLYVAGFTDVLYGINSRSGTNTSPLRSVILIRHRHSKRVNTVGAGEAVLKLYTLFLTKNEI